MGMIKIYMLGSFPTKNFNTCAASGGHVCAIKRGIEFLSAQLGAAVMQDVELTKKGVAPPNAPLGSDTTETKTENKKQKGKLKWD